MSEPNIAKNSPFVLKMEPGSYAWCACGNSKNQPFCDGSHRGSEFRPMVVKIEGTQTVAWCGCKHTVDKPFCDGTHNAF